MASSAARLLYLLCAGAAVASTSPDDTEFALRGAAGPSRSGLSPVHGDKGLHAAEIATEARRLIVEVHFCESTLNVLDPENIHPIWTEPSWVGEGASIFLGVHICIIAVLIVLAWVLDCRTSPVLQRVQEARREANMVHHGEGGALKRSLMERYGAKTEMVADILDEVANKQEEEKMIRRTAQLRLLLKPDADEARKKAMAQILANFCAGFCLNFYYAGLEPAAFQYIRSEELHLEGQAAVQEFLLLPQWQQARIAILTSLRLVAGMMPNYALPRSARVAATLVQGVGAAATACLISSGMGWKVGRSAECHPTDLLQRYLRECLLAFATLLIQEVPYMAILGIRRERFLHSGWNKAALACCAVVRNRAFWFCMHMWFFISLFIIIQFLATSTTEDGDHWIFVTAIILVISHVLKPLVTACCVMSVYVMANYLGMHLVSDEIHNCLRPKHADELTNEDLEQLDRKFLGQLLTCEGDETAHGHKKKKKKKKGKGDVEPNRVDWEEEEGNAQPSNAIQDRDAVEPEPTMLDEVIMADIQAAEEQARTERPSADRPCKAGRRTSEQRGRTAVAEFAAASGLAELEAPTDVQDDQGQEDLEEFESWTPLQSEKSFEDNEPRKAAVIVHASPAANEGQEENEAASAMDELAEIRLMSRAKRTSTRMAVES